jgi:oligopeptide/dipeptide ABC transporter ATP-binding protein
MQPLRRQIQMAFQAPYASLNPRKTIGAIIADPFLIHRTVPKRRVRAEVQELMEFVGLKPEHINRYPQEFSGGQRQRIGIARALALRPKLIICDEPVSALDVSIQAQVVNLLEKLQKHLGLTYIFIAHDLSVVHHVSNRIAVMYLGKIAELASGARLYPHPAHPYAGALLSAIPIPDPDRAAPRARILLEGDAPSPFSPPSGGRFHLQCPRSRAVAMAAGFSNDAHPMCKSREPQLIQRHSDQIVACHFPLEGPAMR